MKGGENNMERKVWTKKDIKDVAQGMGKKFEPNSEISGRLIKILIIN